MQTTGTRRRQARGIKTEEKVLDAAEHLMQTKGFDAAQVSNIVELSGVSVGSFYHHFGSKDAVIHRLVHRFCAQGRARVDELDLASMSPDQALEAVVRATIDQFRTNPELYGSVAARLDTEPEIWVPMRDLRRYYEDLLIARLDQEGTPSRDQVEATMQTVLAVLTHAVIFGSMPLTLDDGDADARLIRIARAVMASEAASGEG